MRRQACLASLGPKPGQIVIFYISECYIYTVWLVTELRQCVGRKERHLCIVAYLGHAIDWFVRRYAVVAVCSLDYPKAVTFYSVAKGVAGCTADKRTGYDVI